VNAPGLTRRQILVGAGAIFMGQLILTTAAAETDWLAISPSEAGFTSDLEAPLDKAIAEKRVWNLHGVVIVQKGRLVLQRYFEGDDNARGSPLGTVAFKADTLHDLRSVSKSVVGLLYGIALADGKVPPPEAPLLASFPNTLTSPPTPPATAGPSIMC
jgi:CubicO group peptidase (beta-lactamase class C family)